LGSPEITEFIKVAARATGEINPAGAGPFTVLSEGDDGGFWPLRNSIEASKFVICLLRVDEISDIG
jgi:hypothetical protein